MRLAVYLSDWFKSVPMGTGILPCGLHHLSVLCNELRGPEAQVDGDVYFEPVGILQSLIERMITVLDRSRHVDGVKRGMELQTLQDDRDLCETNALPQLRPEEDTRRELSAWESIGHCSELAAAMAVHWIEETICHNSKCSANGEANVARHIFDSQVRPVGR
jgi:hypothetical protein